MWTPRGPQCQKEPQLSNKLARLFQRLFQLRLNLQTTRWEMIIFHQVERSYVTSAILAWHQNERVKRNKDFKNLFCKMFNLTSNNANAHPGKYLDNAYTHVAPFAQVFESRANYRVKLCLTINCCTVVNASLNVQLWHTVYHICLFWPNRFIIHMASKIL